MCELTDLGTGVGVGARLVGVRVGGIVSAAAEGLEGIDDGEHHEQNPVKATISIVVKEQTIYARL